MTVTLGLDSKKLLPRSEEISLAAQMLFPEPRRGHHAPLGERSPTSSSKFNKTLEQSPIQRWLYSIDKQAEDLHIWACKLPDAKQASGTDLDSVSPKSSNNEIELDPTFEPLNDGIVRILTTKETLCRMFERAPAVIRREAVLASVEGQIAGLLLWYLYLLHTLTNYRTSLAVARQICLDSYPKRGEVKRGRPLKDELKLFPTLTESSLKRIWSKYQNVAHLWAAYLALKKNELNPVHMPIDQVNIRELLGCAQLLAEFGCNFKVANTLDHRPLDRESLVSASIAVSSSCPGVFEALVRNDEVLSEIEVCMDEHRRLQSRKSALVR
jgi:hypothetical protein